MLRSNAAYTYIAHREREVRLIKDEWGPDARMFTAKALHTDE